MMAVRLFEKYVPPNQPGNQNQGQQKTEKSGTQPSKVPEKPTSTPTNANNKNVSAPTAKHSAKDALEQPELVITKMEGMPGPRFDSLLHYSLLRNSLFSLGFLFVCYCF
jgi:hypothetical protein